MNKNNVDLSKINLNGLNIKPFKTPQPIYEQKGFIEQIEKFEGGMADVHEKREKYKEDILNTLKQIEGNTANLTILINLIQSSNEQQEEIIKIITELLELAKEQNEEIVKSKYREIMSKITTFTEDAETITTLVSFGTMIFSILKAGAS